MLKIKIFKKSPDAIIPKIAYNGTSAAFDITSIEDITIPARGSAIVNCGLIISIPESEPYYMTIHIRSSLGFKKGLSCHTGIIDAGYTGDLGFKIYNLSDTDEFVKKGERFGQILVHKKIPFEFEILNAKEFEAYEASQQRGSKGFGSSGI